VSRIVSDEYASFWDHVAIFRPHFIPVLDKGYNPGYSGSIERFDYRLSMVSYTFGVTEVYTFQAEDCAQRYCKKSQQINVQLYFCE